MARSAATLRGHGVRMAEFPQTAGNLTAAGQNLFELLRGNALALYPAPDLRQRALNAVALDTGRGWRIAKEKASRKVDGLVALSFAALAAVEAPGRAGGIVLAGVVRAQPASLPEMVKQAARARRLAVDRAWRDPREG